MLLVCFWIAFIWLSKCLDVFMSVCRCLVCLKEYGMFLHYMLHVYSVLLSQDTLRYDKMVYPQSMHAYLSHCSLLD